MDKEKLKTYGSILVIIVALFLAFQFFVDTGGTDALLLLEEQANAPETKLVQELFTILQDINRIKLDTTLFSDPLYLSLTDFSVTLVAQERGRVNPFAPFGAGVLATPAK